MIELQAVDCPSCGKQVARGMYTGIVQVVCRNRRCRRRVWLGGNGKQVIVIKLDRPPRRAE